MPLARAVQAVDPLFHTECGGRWRPVNFWGSSRIKLDFGKNRSEGNAGVSESAVKQGIEYMETFLSGLETSPLTHYLTHLLVVRFIEGYIVRRKILWSIKIGGLWLATAALSYLAVWLIGRVPKVGKYILYEKWAQEAVAFICRQPPLLLFRYLCSWVCMVWP